MLDLEDEMAAITAVRAGQQEPFRLLVERYQQRVFRVCVGIMRDHAAAEDVAQETFLTAFHKIDQFDSEKGTFAVWLITIARRLSLNALNKKRPLTMAEPPDLAIASENRAARVDTFQALDEALNLLTEEHRRIFVLAEIEELPHEQIAEMEGIAKGTVKSRVSRAKSTLRGMLQSIYEELNPTK